MSAPWPCAAGSHSLACPLTLPTKQGTVKALFGPHAENIVAREKVIKIRLSEAEMALVEEAVENIGLPLATWARYALLGGARARLAVLLGVNAPSEAEIDF